MNEAALVARYSAPAPRYTSYPTAPHFTPAIGSKTYLKWLGETEGPLSLYLHAPFCQRLCFYCGCNTSVVHLESSLRVYGEALSREIELVARTIGRRVRVSHLHWGGGTPTALPDDVLIATMDLLRKRFALDADAEVAIELDPTTLTPRHIEALRTMGVTRVSLGVQDFDPKVQQAIGRRQTFEETERCADHVRWLGVSSLNLDLIYGLPHQTEDSVAETARLALKLKADRAAVFGYAHVPWMKKHQALISEESLPDEFARYRQQQAIHAVLTGPGGYRAIGLDHYALPEDSMARASANGDVGRGFQGYTTDQAATLIGFGASAIGSLPLGYVQNESSAAAYIKAINGGGAATSRGVTLSLDDRVRRKVIERLMCDLQVDLFEVAAAFDVDPSPLLSDAARLKSFEEDGLASFDGRMLCVNTDGRPFLRAIAKTFDAYLAQQDAKPRHSRAI